MLLKTVKGDKNMEKYRYCVIKPKKMQGTYRYIAEQDVEVGDYVEIPFGYADEIVYGVVRDVGYFSKEDAPYPVEKTKHVIRVISEEEYEAAGADVFESYFTDVPDGEADYREELTEAQKLIDQGNYEEMLQWADYFSDCKDSQTVIDMVIFCYELCAKQGMTLAALNLGTLLYNGVVIQQDYQLAAEYYEIAAAAGEPRALCNLGYCFYYGRHQEVDYEKAFYYFNLGATLHNDANCLYKLGDMYLEGKAVKKNEQYGLMFYIRAKDAVQMDTDDEWCLPDIYLRLGKAYLKEDFKYRNPKIAYNFFLQALAKFYDRRKVDPFARSLIQATKKHISEVEQILDQELC